MIFAHLPTGYLLSLPLRKSWKAFFPLQQYTLIFLVLLGSIFPDFDFLYYYFVSGEVNHRSLVTHTPAVYFVLLVIVLGFSYLRRSVFFVQAAIWAFVVGVLIGHLLPDTLAGEIRWLYPFSDQFYSLRGIFTTFGMNAKLSILFIEGVIISGALLCFALMRKRLVLRLTFLFLSIGFFVGLGIALWSAFPALAPVSEMYYADSDDDRILNPYDDDLDNDGLMNDQDSDRDGDGALDQQDFVAGVQKMQGKWIDQHRGRFLDIPKHLGFIVDADIVHYGLSESGYFANHAMFMDFQIHAEDYIQISAQNNPRQDVLFYERPYNLFILFKNSYRFITFPLDQLQTHLLQKGDMLFFGEPTQFVAVVVSADTQHGRYLVLDVSSFKERSEVVPLDEVIRREGTIIWLARFFP